MWKPGGMSRARDLAIGVKGTAKKKESVENAQTEKSDGQETFAGDLQHRACPDSAAEWSGREV